jgi:hypothetical protein
VVQQLRGPMSAWWSNFTATIQDGHQVLWVEFRTTFYGHHIPVGLVAHKRQEFLHLQQGLSSVYEYNKKFNHLSQYGSYHINTNEKKMSLFCQGLSLVLREHLTLFRGCTLNKLVSASIEQEDACRAHLEEERKKRPLPGPIRGAPPKYRLVYTPPSGQPRGPLCCSRGATAHLNRWPHVLQSIRGRLLHLELRNLLGWVLRASIAIRLGTSLMSAPSLARASLLGPRCRLSVSQRLRSVHRLQELVVPSSLHWRRFLLVRKFLLVRSFCVSTQLLFCSILELLMIS